MKEAITDYLKTMRLKVSNYYVEKLLLSHPDYPSILSASDVLEQLGLNVQVGKIGEKHLPEIPFPYLLYSNANGFLVIENEQTLTKEQEKLKTWEGVLLKAENTEEITDPANEKAYKEEKIDKWSKNVAFSGMSLLLLIAFLPAADFVNSLFLFTAFSGLLLGYVLIAKDLGVKYAPVESFCGAGASNQCDKVLTSEYSIVFGSATFSDLVLSYFAVQTILLGLIIPFSGNVLGWWSILAALSLLSLPAIGYSIYYQWVKIKAWCRLCLLVIGLLILQMGISAYAFQSGFFSFSIPEIWAVLTTMLLFLSIGSATIWVKGFIKKQDEAEHSAALAKRVKYDPKIFTQYLLDQRKVDTTPLKREISIGNPEAPLQLVMASNLFCNPCKAMHTKLNELLQVWPDKLHISFRFLPVKMEDEEGPNPREILLNYWQENTHESDAESQNTQQIIRDWFERKDIDEFINKYETTSSGNRELSEITELQDNWVKEAEIKKTPTLFLNGYEFPQQYSIEDLKSMIPGLIDHFEHERELGDIYHKKHVQGIV